MPHPTRMATRGVRCCTHCRTTGRVIQSRRIETPSSTVHRRRLSCPQCGWRWSIVELLADDLQQLSVAAAQAPLTDADLVDQAPAALRDERAG